MSSVKVRGISFYGIYAESCTSADVQSHIGSRQGCKPKRRRKAMLRNPASDPISEYPSPLTWTRGFAGSWSVQDGPRRLQEGLREPKMTSKMAQDSASSLKMASKMLQDAPRPPQDGPKWPKSSQWSPQRGQNPSKTYRKSMLFAFSPFHFRWPSEASRQLQEGP